MRMSSPSRHRFSVARLSSAEFRSSLNGIRHNHYRKVPWGDFSGKSNFFEMALFPPYSLRSPSRATGAGTRPVLALSGDGRGEVMVCFSVLADGVSSCLVNTDFLFAPPAVPPAGPRIIPIEGKSYRTGRRKEESPATD